MSEALTVIQRAALKQLDALGLPRDARILDAPCGRAAALTQTMLDRGWQAVGLDVDERTATQLSAAFVRADLNAALPLPSDSFDAVVCTEGIEHLENHYAFLRELHRVLKPGGHLVLTTPNITALRSRVRFFGSGFFGRDALPLNETARNPLHHIGLATFPELRYELHTSGFQLVRASHTHIKPISFAYAIYSPWLWLYTRIAFRKEHDAQQRARNREVLAALLSPSLLFGECLLLLACKLPQKR